MATQATEAITEDPIPGGCVCIDYCSDDPSQVDCPRCKAMDPYDPCPVVGFGCGAGCDCCTPAQQTAADSSRAGQA